jgi:hypothetical protein
MLTTPITSATISTVPVWRVLGAVLLLAAIVCGVIAAATWDNAIADGAYLNRSIGKPAYSAVISTWGASDGPRILLGAAIALAVAGILVLVVSVIQTRNRAPAPQAPAADRAP